jgi:aspartate aminotransferase
MAADALRLARRLDEVGFSDIVQVRNKVMELRAAGQTVHAFHGGEPFFETPNSVKYALLSAAVDNKTRYAPSSGIEPLRQAIAAKLNERNGLAVSAENVIVTAGGRTRSMLPSSRYWTRATTCCCSLPIGRQSGR